MAGCRALPIWTNWTFFVFMNNKNSDREFFENFSKNSPVSLTNFKNNFWFSLLFQNQMQIPTYIYHGIKLKLSTFLMNTLKRILKAIIIKSIKRHTGNDYWQWTIDYRFVSLNLRLSLIGPQGVFLKSRLISFKLSPSLY